MLRSGLEKRVMTLKKEKEEKKTGGKAAADMRLNKDLSEVDFSNNPNVTLVIPVPENSRELLLTLKPTEGHYQGGTFKFKVSVPYDYPHTPPKVFYDLAINQTKIFHPNIDEDGKVCLNILRAEWRPVLTIKAVIFGMQLLFSEPNPDDPLNKKAAKLLREDKKMFTHVVRAWMRGDYV
ncbi:NEDD8-conjugating enzyme Ubc12 [Diplonema papillatum]|nr:NEDD8-conjugating enzyme Ubc12 [Diplonema papillatum]